MEAFLEGNGKDVFIITFQGEVVHFMEIRNFFLLYRNSMYKALQDAFCFKVLNVKPPRTPPSSFQLIFTYSGSGRMSWKIGNRTI